MDKHKVIFLALALSFSCGMLTISPASALDETVNGEITVTDDEDPSSGSDVIESSDSDAVITSETEAEGNNTLPEDDCDGTTDEECQSDPERYDTELENALDEGLANEPEVICATGDEEGCADDGDPAVWPLYVSLGALGATIILVLIINLLGRKQK